MTRIDVGHRERVNFYLDANILDGMKKLSGILNMTYSEAIRQACREWLIREGQKAIDGQKTIIEINHETP